MGCDAHSIARPGRGLQGGRLKGEGAALWGRRRGEAVGLERAQGGAGLGELGGEPRLALEGEREREGQGEGGRGQAQEEGEGEESARAQMTLRFQWSLRVRVS